MDGDALVGRRDSGGTEIGLRSPESWTARDRLPGRARGRADTVARRRRRPPAHQGQRPAALLPRCRRCRDRDLAGTRWVLETLVDGEVASSTLGQPAVLAAGPATAPFAALHRLPVGDRHVAPRGRRAGDRRPARHRRLPTRGRRAGRARGGGPGRRAGSGGRRTSSRSPPPTAAGSPTARGPDVPTQRTERQRPLPQHIGRLRVVLVRQAPVVKGDRSPDSRRPATERSGAPARPPRRPVDQSWCSSRSRSACGAGPASPSGQPSVPRMASGRHPRTAGCPRTSAGGHVSPPSRRRWRNRPPRSRPADPARPPSAASMNVGKPTRSTYSPASA